MNTDTPRPSQLASSGLRRPQAWRVTRRIFLPTLATLLTLLLGPMFLVAGAMHFTDQIEGRETQYLRLAHALVLGAVT